MKFRVDHGTKYEYASATYSDIGVVPGVLRPLFKEYDIEHFLKYIKEDLSGLCEDLWDTVTYVHHEGSVLDDTIVRVVRILED